MYQELGLGSLKSRNKYKPLSFMFKISNKETPNHLINSVPKNETNIRTRSNNIPTCNCQTDCFIFSFLLNYWFNLDFNTSNFESILTFKSRLLSFIHSVQTNIYNSFDSKGLTFLNRQRLTLSHLNEHRFLHNF